MKKYLFRWLLGDKLVFIEMGRLTDQKAFLELERRIATLENDNADLRRDYIYAINFIHAFMEYFDLSFDKIEVPDYAFRPQPQPTRTAIKVFPRTKKKRA